MFTSKEKDDLLRKIESAHGDYQTEDESEKTMLNELKDEGFVRLLRGSGIYITALTDKGITALKKGGFTEVNREKDELEEVKRQNAFLTKKNLELSNENLILSNENYKYKKEIRGYKLLSLMLGITTAILAIIQFFC